LLPADQLEVSIYAYEFVTLSTQFAKYRLWMICALASTDGANRWVYIHILKLELVKFVIAVAVTVFNLD
jgi:uncharacterized membrane protein YagU involved in acid resistance